MLTRAQSKAIKESVVPVAPDTTITPDTTATVAPATDAPASAVGVSDSETSASSATIRARTLAVQASYARKIAAAEAKALELELQAEIAQIEAEGSQRGSTRRSSYRSDRSQVEVWLEKCAPLKQVLTKQRGAASSGAHTPVCPGSPTPVVPLGPPVQPVGDVVEGTSSSVCRDYPASTVAAPHPCIQPVGAVVADAPYSVCRDYPASTVAAPPNPCIPPPAGGPSILRDRVVLTHAPPGLTLPAAGTGAQDASNYCNNNTNPSDILLLAQTIQNLSKDGAEKRLPCFDGKIYDWLAFKRAYDSSKLSYSPLANLSRLNSALFGPAREAVGALLSTAQDPKEVIEVLELHFGRPELIVLHEVAAVRSLPKVNVEGKDLHFFAGRVRSCISVMKFLNDTSYLESPELFNSLLLKLTPAMRARWKDYAKSHFHLGLGTKLELLGDFLSEEVTTELRFGAITEAYLTDRPHNSKTFRTSVVDTTPRTNPNKQISENKKHLQLSQNKPLSCLYCHQCHIIDNCDKFIHLDIMAKLEWVREQKVCSRCLKKGSHRYSSCNPKTLCQVAGCKFRHHKLLHRYDTTTEVNLVNVEPEASSSSIQTTEICDTVAHSLSEGPLKALLKVIAVTVSGPSGSVDTYALLDDGSSSTFIDMDVAHQIGVGGPRTRIRVDCMGGLSKFADIEYVDFFIKGRDVSTSHEVKTARAISNLGIACQSIAPNDIRHLSIPNFTYENAEPKLIIGIDNWQLLIPSEVRQGSKTQPAACLTPLGWVVFGFSSSRTKPVAFVNHSVTSDVNSDDFSELENLIRENYKLEAVGIIKRQVQSAADERAVNILEHTARRLPSGQFEVGLLWLSDDADIPNSYPLALSRFNSLEKRFKRDVPYADQYRQNVHAMINKGYAEPCALASDSPRVWYLPHFGVVNPNKPGKLRVVHDAAAVVQGTSLNSLLLTGPDLLSSLIDIIYRFREDQIGMAADIREMFPQIKIRSQDRDAQRFLWRDSPDLPISIYRMSSMIFGAASSPFTALHIKNKNADENRESFPEAAHAIVHDTYMDDYIGSVDSIDRAARLAGDIVEVHKRAHFEVRGWVSNEPNALALVPPELRLDNSCHIDLGSIQQSVRTLGLIWDPSSDQLGFNSEALKTALVLPSKITKRHALSSLMRVFDPLGILAPITIRGRIIFQVSWRRKIDWDQALPADLLSQWKSWLSDMTSAVELKLPRWHSRGTQPIERELHVFCDASEHAYVAVAYWRLIYSHEHVQLSFICSKARVAPLTPVTISRLELQAATVAARLASSICEAHKFKPARRYFWTDSKNVLGWLRSDARSFLPFVAHRLADILELSSLSEWRWVPTVLNVADDATRGDPGAVLANSRWIEGPEFLKAPYSDWPIEVHGPSNLNTTELKPSAKINLRSYLIDVNSSTSTIPIIRPVSADPSRFSQWIRLIRATARAHQCANFFRRLRGTASVSASTSHTPARSSHSVSAAQLPPLSAENLRVAQTHVLLRSQEESFPEELAALRLAEPLSRHSKLAKLDIHLSHDGLIILTGRIGAAAEITASNNPILLDASHPATKLLIDHYHRRLAHANNETVVNEIRQQFWILSLRSAVRSVAHDCKLCKIRRTQPLNPPLGNLPEARLAHHRRPFTFVGLDYFGPVLVTVGRRHEKRYVALFTCLTTRAVHLEVVHDLSTDAALMALRRFTARRGSPSQIWSDNGTAFVGAAKFLRQLYGPEMENYATNVNIEWRFIPPSAPSMGGAWERLVRSVKSALKGTLTERAPQEYILATLLAEAEAVVNSRPLTHVSAQPEEEEALTPFHFLIGTSSTANNFATAEPQDMYGRASWRKALRLCDIFWQRWVREYLTTLVPRRVSGKVGPPVAVGDLVLVVDGNLPRGSWPRGRITRVFPGADAIIRVAEVSTAAGLLRRPCKKLVRLPV